MAAWARDPTPDVSRPGGLDSRVGDMSGQPGSLSVITQGKTMANIVGSDDSSHSG